MEAAMLVPKAGVSMFPAVHDDGKRAPQVYHMKKG